MGAPHDLTTDTGVPIPWQDGAPDPVEPVLHLVVVWFAGEPDRIGQAACIDSPCWLGRAHAEAQNDSPLQFFEQRPGRSLAVSDFATTAISRRQLEFTPIDAQHVHAKNTGKRALFVNGRPVTECTVTIGDTLMLEATALFLVEARPRELELSGYYQGPRFTFGYADAHGMVGESPAAWDLREQLAGAALSDAHVLLIGETGAGKEVAAQVVHGLSARSRGPMVARNAATMPGTLLDAELFGSAKNYPNTGAPEREGLVGAANGGHLMLDEIGELPEGHQAHLLRVLDGGGQYHRLGEKTPRVSDFRLIAATNRDPTSLKHDLVARFRHTVHVPGLNDRRSDIPFLIRELVARAMARSPDLVHRFLESGDLHRPRLQPHLVDALLRHHYRSHTRELERLLALSLTSSRGEYLLLTPQVHDELDRARAALAELEPNDEPPVPGARLASADVERALEAAQGNVTQAANLLGVSRHAVHRLIRAYGLLRRFGSS